MRRRSARWQSGFAYPEYIKNPRKPEAFGDFHCRSEHAAAGAPWALTAGNIARDIFTIDITQFALAFDIVLIHFIQAGTAAVAGGFHFAQRVCDNLLALLARGIFDQYACHTYTSYSLVMQSDYTMACICLQDAKKLKKRI